MNELRPFIWAVSRLFIPALSASLAYLAAYYLYWQTMRFSLIVSGVVLFAVLYDASRAEAHFRRRQALIGVSVTDARRFLGRLLARYPIVAFAGWCGWTLTYHLTTWPLVACYGLALAGGAAAYGVCVLSCWQPSAHGRGKRLITMTEASERASSF